MLLILMHGLLGSVVPTSVDPFFIIDRLPSSVNLGDDGFCNVVGILYVNPVANFPCVTFVSDMWQGYATFCGLQIV